MSPRACLPLILGLALSAQEASPYKPAHGGVPGFDLKGLVAAYEASNLKSVEGIAETARLLHLMGDTAGAEARLERALLLGGSVGDVLRKVALVRLAQGRVDEALKLYDQMVVVAPKDDNLFAKAAVDLVQAGQSDRADAMMERSYALDPRDWRDVLGFATEAARAGRTSLAVKWFGKIRKMDRDDIHHAARPVLERLILAGQAEEAAALAETILAIQPDDWEVAFSVAQAAIQARKPELTQAWMARALKCEPKDPELNVRVALLAKGFELTYHP